MAWSYCDDVEGTCASCAGFGGNCKMCLPVGRHAVSEKDHLRHDGFPGMPCEACAVAAMDNVIHVAYSAVTIHGIHQGFNPAPAMLSSNSGSSEPVTPFADFVDKAVEGVTFQKHYNDPVVGDQPAHTDSPPVDEPSHTELTTDSAYVNSYRSAAEPLSEWVAEYAWKVCTRGMGLPDRFAQHGPSVYSVEPPSRLAQMIRNLLWSTLLQPSGVFLALWYIARLPVHLDWQIAEGCVSIHEHNFRAELLGGHTFASNPPGGDVDSREVNVVFRLVLLGCMLANKWLDDHTFSNKTWHSISDVPVGSINRLELLALALLKHDLSVKSNDWQNWLLNLRQSDRSMWPYPSPIRRPTVKDSNAIIRDAIDGLLLLSNHQLSIDASGCKAVPQPSFSCLLSGLRGCRVDKRLDAFDPFEIDLDEDGPLRDEYVPRRRSLRGSLHKSSPPNGYTSHNNGPVSPFLPPPANWSPQADPPIERNRDKNRLSGLSIHARTSSHENATTHFEGLSTSKWQSHLTSVQPSGSTRDIFMHHVDEPSATDAFSETCRPPISHTRSTSTMANFNGSAVVHTRSFSIQAPHDNSIGVPSIARGYFGYPNANMFGHEDLAHFRPMWLRT